MNNQPLYEHDCDRCIYLGQFEDAGIKYDLYFCKQNGFKDTVVGRFGDNGWEYASGLEIANIAAELAEAKRRAIELNLLENKDGLE